FKEIEKTTLLLIYEDYVPFKTYNKKKVRKIKRGNSSSIKIILNNEVKKLPKLPTLLKYPYLI
ncbi:hypothetical protein B0T20DRAFT_335590, partial [Sordaria brevicollis]